MPVPLRTDFDAHALRAIARTTKDGPQARRLLALAAIYEGATRTEAARLGGVTGQIVRDWVVKFNVHRCHHVEHALTDLLQHRCIRAQLRIREETDVDLPARLF